MNLPDVVREAWQPVIDAATASQDEAASGPGGLSARIAGEIGMPGHHPPGEAATPQPSDAEAVVASWRGLGRSGIGRRRGWGP